MCAQAPWIPRCVVSIYIRTFCLNDCHCRLGNRRSNIWFRTLLRQWFILFWAILLVLGTGIPFQASLPLALRYFWKLSLFLSVESQDRTCSFSFFMQIYGLQELRNYFDVSEYSTGHKWICMVTVGAAFWSTGQHQQRGWGICVVEAMRLTAKSWRSQCADILLHTIPRVRVSRSSWEVSATFSNRYASTLVEPVHGCRSTKNSRFLLAVPSLHWWFSAVWNSAGWGSQSFTLHLTILSKKN